MSDSLHFTGIDPDLHAVGFAACDADGDVLWVRSASVSKVVKDTRAVLAMSAKIVESLRGPRMSLAGSQIVCVENQDIYLKTTKNPRNILSLGQVAGACVAAAVPTADHIIFPRPKQWKGDTPKRIHQARLYADLGLKYTRCGSSDRTGYVVPRAPGWVDGGESLRKGAWKHVNDAILLARWAAKQWAEARKNDAIAIRLRDMSVTLTG